MEARQQIAELTIYSGPSGLDSEVSGTGFPAGPSERRSFMEFKN